MPVSIKIAFLFKDPVMEISRRRVRAVNMRGKPTMQFSEKITGDGGLDESGGEDGQWQNRTNTWFVKNDHINLLVKKGKGRQPINNRIDEN